MKIYLDESGNSGANIKDLSQPLFSIGAVWVAPGKESLIEEQVAFLKKQRGIQMPELKGSALIKSTRGKKFLFDILNFCSENDIGLMATVCQKAFIAASVFVEDCVDHHANTGFSEIEASHIGFKNDLAKMISDRIPALTF